MPEIKPYADTPPELETIEIEIADRIATVTLNRPDSFNSMDPVMISELPTAFGWLADRSDARAAIVTGAGNAFCAGGDISSFKNGVEAEDIDAAAEVRRGAETLHQGIIDLRRIPFPVIAAVNGPAAGAGFSLALACDYRIASTEAFFACAYGRIGLSPDGGLTWLLPRAVGATRAAEILLNDPNIGAESALEERLVSETVAPDELMDRARTKAAKLAAMSPHYVRTFKRLLATTFDNSFEHHLQLERHGIADSLNTRDAREAVGAFLAGETPTFRGE